MIQGSMIQSSMIRGSMIQADECLVSTAGGQDLSP